MSRKKTPENETEDEKIVRQTLEKVSGYPERSDKTAWQRKMGNLEKLVAELKPIEDILLDFNSRKQEIVDKITMLRKEMVENCLHPYEMLVLNEDHVRCSFCNRKINIPK